MRDSTKADIYLYEDYFEQASNVSPTFSFPCKKYLPVIHSTGEISYYENELILHFKLNLTFEINKQKKYFYGSWN